MPGLALMGPATVRANPSGGVVVNGGIEIGENLGGHLRILQSTQKGIINWEDFSISAGELTEFLQPGRDASTLNRVVSGNPSAIQGALRANGKLFVINPNGIMVGPGGSIDVAGLVLSTLDVSDGDYLTGGDMIFRGSSGAGVKNFGRINAIGGDVFLMGNTVENTGTITASGTVGLAAGEEVLITANPDANGERVFVKPAGGVGAGTGISNTGGIEGAAVELKAHGNLYALAINNQGSLRATGANRSGGAVYLRAPGGRVENGGNIEATLPDGDGGRILIEGAVVNAGGVIDASATTQQGQGGEITLLGGEISVTGRVAADGATGGRVVIGDRDTGSARIENGARVSADGDSDGGGSVIVQGAEVAILDADISANGLAGGGEVNVGGGFQGGDAEIANAINTRVSEAARISADGLADGSGGGQVVIWADERTDFAGRISAEARGTGDGGFVEVSGKKELVFGGMVSTLSAGGGRNGTLLLDPSNFNVTAGGAPGTVNGIGDVTLETLLGANHVIIATDAGGVEEGNVTVESGAEVTWNNANALTVLAHGDILLDASVQNGGTGGVHLVAGWNGSANAPGSSGASVPGSVITAADFTPAEYGIADGRVVIGDGSQGNAIRVGSRGGSTTVAADGLSLNGSAATASAAAQLGYFVDGGGPVTGGVDLYLKDGGLSLNAGTAGSYAQIGHGGMGATNGATIDAPITITFTTPGAVNVLGGSDLDAYAQIGHGGRAYASNGLGGNIDIIGAGASLVSGGSSGGAYAQIGHGGRSASDGTGVFSGDISFATVNGADLTVRGTQAAGALADGRWAYGQIGHGGASARGDAIGGIDLSLAGGLTVLGGRLIDAVTSRAQNYAQVGHGGWDGDGAHSGDISLNVSGGDVEIRAGLSRESYAQVGHGGRNENVGGNSGAIDVDITSGSLNLIGGNGGGGGEFAYAQLGHGGGSATGSHSGDITVDASNQVTLLQGVRDGAYKLIGHGGHSASGSHSGSIHVNAVNDIRLVGGSNDIDFAQIGHGGYASSGSMSAPVIEVISSQGAIELTGGNLGSSSNDGRFAYAQIGLGGHQSDGDHSAAITVQAQDGITIRGGSRDHNYALIGNGGDLSDGTKTGDISVTTASGNILLAAAANHELSGAQIGHGGFRALGAASGEIDVMTGAGSLTLRNGGGDDNDPSPTFTTGEFSYSYAQIGHGGAQGGNFNRSGDISIQVTGDVSLNSGFGPGVRAYTQVGHGGYDAAGDFSGTIDLESSGGGIALISGANEGQFAKVGHGGVDSAGEMEGAITLTAGGGGVSAVAGAGDNTLAQIGHGGIHAAGEKTGDITIDALAGGIELSGGSGALALGQIGHGGYHGAGSVTGAVSLTATGDIDVLAGAGQSAYALVGHGGLYATGLHDGDIEVNTDGAVTIAGGGTPGDGVEGTDNFGQIGHSLQGATAGFGQFVEINGQVVIEAEGYTTNPSGLWVVVPTSADPTPGPDPFLNARGDVYLQLPDGSGAGGAAGSGKEVTYEVQIDTAGTYRLYPRWTGHDGGSDSMFIDVVELKDGNGGVVADWYEFQEGGFSNFNSPAWSTTGAFEANNATATPRVAALIDIPAPGTYTIRVNAREDGFGLDAIALLPEAAAAPTGLGPAPTYAQRSGALGAVTVNAGGNISVNGGLNSGSHGAIGHGGSRVDNFAGRVSYGSATDAADITVRSTGGDVLLSGGANVADSGLPTGRYASIGHHGSQSDFDAYGDVEVEGGNFTLTGGTSDGSGARIGHGGDGASLLNLNDAEGPATLSGAVKVMAADSITLLGGSAHTGGLTGGAAQLGHGGIRDSLTLMEIDGEICVVSGEGVILNAANGDGVGGYTQIGHGGIDLVGSKSGKIAVTSGATGSGGVALTGGNVAGTYAQIGHGGIDSSGDMSGDLSVVADNGGAISLTGGAGADNYAMTGHGDGGGVTSTGTRQGGVRLFADGGLSASDGGTANTSVFHQTNGGLAAVDYLGGNGFQLLANGANSFSDSSLNGVNTMVNGNFGNGPVSFAFANDIDIAIGAGQDWLVNSSDNFLMATGGSITMLSSFQNAGDGAVTLVAGWDGIDSLSGGEVSYNGGDFCDPSISAPDGGIDFNNCDAFGNNGALLVIGDSAQNAAVRLGSRGGATTLAGRGLTMDASTTTVDASTQVGFFGDGSGPASGAISLHLQGGGLAMNSGVGGAFTQIGHGGRNSVNGNVDAGIAISFCDPGDLTMTAGTGTHSYSQIGHGGFGKTGDGRGNLSILGAGEVIVLGGSATDAYAQIGHGGNLATGNHAGAITVEAAGNALFDATAGVAGNAYVQLGHGGGNAAGNFGGAIQLDAGLDGSGDIQFLAGGGSGNYAQLGHGGLSGGGTISGGIAAETSGAVLLQGGGATDSFALIGHGGVNRSGNLGATGEVIRVNAQNGVGVFGGGGTRSFGQIGHGGVGGGGTYRGDVFVNADPVSGATTGGGAVTVRGGGGGNAHAQIGLGGTLSATQIGFTAVHGDSVEVQVGAGGTASARIGAGGGVNNTATITSGTRVVATNGSVIVDARDGGGNAYAQIGAGGLGGVGTITGITDVDSSVSTTVEATGAVEVLAGGGNNASAMIGAGGAGRGSSTANGAKTDAGVSVIGDSVRVIGGAGGGAFAKIGSGGGRTSGNNASVGPVDGEISVTTTGGDLEVVGGGSRGFAQIGHGGINFSGDIDGGIVLRAAGGSSLISGNHADGYALVGHGGADAAGSFTGDICFHSSDGLMLQSSGSSFTQIGHGGRNATVGSLAGNLTVTALGDVSLSGGGATNTYAQIGHGGINTSAPMSGDIFVVADNGGNFDVNGGVGTSAYAMVGHGDGVGVAGDEDSGTSGGTREGGIQYFVDGNATVANGAGGNAYLHHRTNTDGGLNLTTPTYLGGNGYQYVVNGTNSVVGNALEGFDAMVGGNIGMGHIVVATNNPIDYTHDGPDLFFDHDFDFIIMTGGNINLLSSYQNAGNGRAILVAGWDGVTGSPGSVNLDNLCAPIIQPGTIDFNDCDSFGNNGGMVTLGSASQTAPVLFASRQGMTALAGHGVVLNAGSATSGAATQVGFYGDASGAITGEILIRGKAGGLTMNSGATNAYTQIGHGGRGSVGATIDAPLTISFCEPGDVTLNAGTGTDAYAQIGHGGRGVTGTRAGDILISGIGGGQAGAMILNGGSGTHSYAQIGHGGLATSGGSGATRGSIRIDSNAAVEITGGSGQDAYSQIGHGGHDNNGSHGAVGDQIVIIADEGFSLIGGDTSGTQFGAYAQIGNGGYDADGVLRGDIFLNFDPLSNTAAGGGDIILLGSAKTAADNNFGTVAMIGHGGRNQTGAKFGDIVIGAADNLTMTGGQAISFAQIGHGGNDSSTGANGDVVGSILIDASGDVAISGGDGNDAYSQIGHGGYRNSGGTEGEIELRVGGNLELSGGAGTRAYGQIGSGGAESGNSGTGVRTGGTLIEVGGTVDIIGGAGTDAYAHIGHGGRNAAAGLVIDGGIEVNAVGDVRVISGGGTGSYAQVGQGGYIATNGAGTYSGDTILRSTGGSIDLDALSGGGGSNSHVQIGHGGLVKGDGTMSGATTVEAAGALVMRGGDSGSNRYAQIGMGGAGADGDKLGADVSVNADSLLMKAGSGSAAYVQIGAGGSASGGNNVGLGNIEGNVNVTTTGGGITLEGTGGGSRNFAQIGSGGGNDNNANIGAGNSVGGNINVTSVGSLTVDATNAYYAQIGHGGRRVVADSLGGEIRVTADGDFALLGGAADRRYAQIGHGGSDSNSIVADSDIHVDVTGGMTLTGASTQAYSQIGHGGYDAITFTVADSSLFINTAPGSGGGDIALTGGTGSNSAAMIGHGGSRTDANRGLGDISASGDITIGNAANILMNAGSTSNAFAQIGHGGEGAVGTHDGAVTITATGRLLVQAGTGGNAASAQVGHGGVDTLTDMSGDLILDFGGDVELGGGSANQAYAQIGHGGRNSSGTREGGILLDATGSVSLTGGSSTDTYTQIGHGGDASQGDTGGDIVVNAGGSVALNGGNASSDAYAQIGHGGHGNGGTHGANGERIEVNAATGSVSLTAGNATDTYAQIGHAGNAASGAVVGTDIVVNASDAISLQTGGTQAYAQIGHGGFNTMNLEVTDADISINTAANTGAGDLSLLGIAGVNAYAQIGHGGSRTDGNANFVVKSGDITVGQAADITLASGTETDNYTQIGHGGEGGNSLGTLADFSGKISLNASGDVSLAGGSGVDAYAQIGHGGDNAVSNTRGSIDLIAGGAVSLAGGAGNLDAYAQIGHGGHGNDAVHGAADEHIAVTGRTGGVSLLGGATTDNYAQIGHGGNGTTSTLGGDIFVNIDPATLLPTTISGDVSLEGGATRAYAQIGHGGYAGAGQITGLVAAFAGGRASLTGGASADAYAQIGHGGRSYQGDLGDDNDGIVVAAQSGVILEAGAGDRAYTQIGNGGHEAAGDLQAGVFVNFDPINGIDIGGGPISLSGGGLEAYAQIGHGGYAVDGTKAGDVVVTGTGDADLVGGDAVHAYVQIGHGGVDTVGNTVGDITLAVGGHLDLLGGGGEGAFSHIGHGGDRTRGGLSGDLTVSTGDGVTFTGGTASGAHAQLGHGGREHRGFGVGGITVAATTGDISLAGGDVGGYALLGHGGESIIGYAMEGDVSATAEGGSVLLTGGGDDAFAQIGHGGRSVGGPKRGRVEVAASDNVSLMAGAGSEAYAQIGLGGSDSDGAELGGVDDATVVVAGGDVTLRASDSGQAASAMIGHGGVSTGALSNQGAVLVEAGGDVGITGGAANFAMAQIGNGGLGAGGTIRGNVLVQAENVAVSRGTGLHAYGKIGNGDHYLDSPVGQVGDSGSVGGDIQVLARRDITLQGGMIGGLDPTLEHRSATAAGDTFLAVSRNDPTATGTGNLIGDTDSVLAAGLGGELRLYLPTRANNQLASGVNLNGTDYPGANVDPMNQQIDEWVIHQIDENGVEVLTPDEHRNLINGELNFIAGIVSPETANYSDVLGDYSLYYDTITVVEAGPPVIPVDPGDGGAGGGSAGGGGDTGGGALPGPGGGEESAPEVVIVTGPDGTRQVIELTLNPDGSLPMFITLPDGTVGFAPGRLGTGSPFVPVGFVLESLLDDRLLDDQHETLVIHRDPRHPWENGGDTDFTIEYQPSGLPGWSSFNVFGDPLSTGAAFTPVSAGSDLNPSLRAYLEGLEIQSAELRTGAE